MKLGVVDFPRPGVLFGFSKDYRSHAFFQASFIATLIMTSVCAEHFTCMMPSNPYNDPVKQILGSIINTEKQVQEGQVAC